MDFSYQPMGWTCQNLVNNTAGQNLGYDAHAPNLPGHPSVRPLKGEAPHLMAGGPGDSVGGPISNEQMRLHFDTTTAETYADGVAAVNPSPESAIAQTDADHKVLASVNHGSIVGSNVSTPQTRDGRYDPPTPFPVERATPAGEKQFAADTERAGKSALETERAAQDVKPAGKAPSPKASK